MKGARKLTRSDKMRAAFRAHAQQLADNTGEIVRFRAPGGAVLIEASPR